MKSDYERKERLLKLQFQRAYDSWNTVFNDDRLLFCNMYEIMLEACNDMKKVKNNTIAVAFNRYFAEEMETMLRIYNRFA